MSVIDFVLGDLSVVQRLGATERWLLDTEGSVHRVRVRIAEGVPCRRMELNLERGTGLAPVETTTLQTGNALGD